MATATDQNPNQTKVPGVAGSRPAAGGNSAPEVSKFAPEWQQALAGNYKQPARSIAEGWDLPQLGLRGLQNFLKLRTRHQFSDRLTADLGVDINALNQAIIPRAALSYQLKAKDVDVGLLRASPTRLALIRSWDVDLKRVGVSFKVNGSAGITYQGRPDFGVDFGDIKPKALVVAAAALLLVMGKPLSGSKTFGNVILRPPQFEHDLFGTGEAKLMLKREEKGGLNVSLKQLNAIVRL